MQATARVTSEVWLARSIAMAKNVACALYVCGDLVAALMQAEHVAGLAREHMAEGARDAACRPASRTNDATLVREMHALAQRIHRELPQRYPDHHA